MLQFKQQVDLHRDVVVAAAFDSVLERLLTSDGQYLHLWTVQGGGSVELFGKAALDLPRTTRLSALLAAPRRGIFLALSSDEKSCSMGAQVVSVANQRVHVGARLALDRQASSALRGEGYKSLPPIACSCATLGHINGGTELIVGDRQRGGAWVWAVRSTQGKADAQARQYRMPLRLRITDRVAAAAAAAQQRITLSSAPRGPGSPALNTGPSVGPTAFAVDEAAGRIFGAVGRDIRAWDMRNGKMVINAVEALDTPAIGLALCESTRRLAVTCTVKPRVGASSPLARAASPRIMPSQSQLTKTRSESQQQFSVWRIPPPGPPRPSSGQLHTLHLADEVQQPAPKDHASPAQSPTSTRSSPRRKHVPPSRSAPVFVGLGDSLGSLVKRNNNHMCLCALDDERTLRVWSPHSELTASQPMSFELSASYLLPTLSATQGAAQDHDVNTQHGHGRRSRSPIRGSPSRRSPSPLSGGGSGASESAWLFHHTTPRGRHIILAVNNTCASCLELHCPTSAAYMASTPALSSAVECVRAPYIRDEWTRVSDQTEDTNAVLLLNAEKYSVEVVLDSERGSGQQPIVIQLASKSHDVQHVEDGLAKVTGTNGQNDQGEKSNPSCLHYFAPLDALFVGWDNGSVIVFAVDTGFQLRTLEPSFTEGAKYSSSTGPCSAKIHCMCIVPLASVALTADADGNAWVNTGSHPHAQDDVVHLVLTGCADGQMRMWLLSPFIHKPVPNVQAHSSTIIAIEQCGPAENGRERMFLSASSIGELKIWRSTAFDTAHATAIPLWEWSFALSGYLATTIRPLCSIVQLEGMAGAPSLLCGFGTGDVQLWRLPLPPSTADTKQRVIGATRAATAASQQHTNRVTALSCSCAEKALRAPARLRGTGAFALSMSQDYSAVMWRVSTDYLKPMRRFAFSDTPQFATFVVSPPPYGPSVLAVVGTHTFVLDCDAMPTPPPPASESRLPLDIEYFGSAVQADIVSQLASPFVSMALPEKIELQGKPQQILQPQFASFKPVTDRLSNRRVSVSAFSTAPSQLKLDISLQSVVASKQQLDDASPQSALNDLDSGTNLKMTASETDTTGLNSLRPMSAGATPAAEIALSRLSPLSPLRGTGAAALMRRRRHFAEVSEITSVRNHEVGSQQRLREQNALRVMGTLPPTTDKLGMQPDTNNTGQVIRSVAQHHYPARVDAAKLVTSDQNCHTWCLEVPQIATEDVAEARPSTAPVHSFLSTPDLGSASAASATQEQVPDKETATVNVYVPTSDVAMDSQLFQSQSQSRDLRSATASAAASLLEASISAASDAFEMREPQTTVDHNGALTDLSVRLQASPSLASRRNSAFPSLTGLAQSNIGPPPRRTLERRMPYFSDTSASAAGVAGASVGMPLGHADRALELAKLAAQDEADFEASIRATHRIASDKRDDRNLVRLRQRRKLYQTSVVSCSEMEDGKVFLIMPKEHLGRRILSSGEGYEEEFDTANRLAEEADDEIIFGDGEDFHEGETDEDREARLKRESEQEAEQRRREEEAAENERKRKEREAAELARKAEEEAKAKYLEAERVALEELEKQRKQRWKMQQEPVSWDELSSRQQHVEVAAASCHLQTISSADAAGVSVPEVGVQQGNAWDNFYAWYTTSSDARQTYLSSELSFASSDAVILAEARSAGIALPVPGDEEAYAMEYTVAVKEQNVDEDKSSKLDDNVAEPHDDVSGSMDEAKNLQQVELMEDKGDDTKIENLINSATADKAKRWAQFRCWYWHGKAPAVVKSSLNGEEAEETDEDDDERAENLQEGRLNRRHAYLNFRITACTMANLTLRALRDKGVEIGSALVNANATDDTAEQTEGESPHSASESRSGDEPLKLCIFQEYDLPEDPEEVDPPPPPDPVSIFPWEDITNEVERDLELGIALHDPLVRAMAVARGLDLPTARATRPDASDTGATGTQRQLWELFERWYAKDGNEAREQLLRQELLAAPQDQEVAESFQAIVSSEQATNDVEIDVDAQKSSTEARHRNRFQHWYYDPDDERQARLCFLRKTLLQLVHLCATGTLNRGSSFTTPLALMELPTPADDPPPLPERRIMLYSWHVDKYTTEEVLEWYDVEQLCDDDDAMRAAEAMHAAARAERARAAAMAAHEKLRLAEDRKMMLAEDEAAQLARQFERDLACLDGALEKDGTVKGSYFSAPPEDDFLPDLKFASGCGLQNRDEEREAEEERQEALRKRREAELAERRRKAEEERRLLEEKRRQALEEEARRHAEARAAEVKAIKEHLAELKQQRALEAEVAALAKADAERQKRQADERRQREKEAARLHAEMEERKRLLRAAEEAAAAAERDAAAEEQARFDMASEDDASQAWRAAAKREREHRQSRQRYLDFAFAPFKPHFSDESDDPSTGDTLAERGLGLWRGAHARPKRRHPRDKYCIPHSEHILDVPELEPYAVTLSQKFREGLSLPAPPQSHNVLKQGAVSGDIGTAQVQDSMRVLNRCNEMPSVVVRRTGAFNVPHRSDSDMRSRWHKDDSNATTPYATPLDSFASLPGSASASISLRGRSDMLGGSSTFEGSYRSQMQTGALSSQGRISRTSFESSIREHPKVAIEGFAQDLLPRESQHQSYGYV